MYIENRINILYVYLYIYMCVCKCNFIRDYFTLKICYIKNVYFYIRLKKFVLYCMLLNQNGVGLVGDGPIDVSII